MKTIYKYEIEITDDQFLKLPPYSRILKAGMQGQSLFIWVLLEKTYVDLIEEKPEEAWEYKMVVRGTGHPIESDTLQHIDTVFDPRGFVWHVFYDLSYEGKVPYNKYPKKK